jgi:PAS domain S-box-containing protein
MVGPERWLSTVHPDDIPRIQKALQAIMSGHLPQLTEEYRIILPDGDVRWVRDNVQMRRREGSTRLDGVVSNITERKETEDALRLSEASLKDALLAAHMGIWEWKASDGTLTWDENFYRIAGRDPKSPFPDDQEQSEMFAPESWERLKLVGENALTTGIPFEIDLELIRPDGAKRWLTRRGKPWRDAHGRITQLRGTVQDMTERRREEEALRASESRYRLLFQNNVAAIICNKLDGCIIDGNEPAARILGYESAREMFGVKIKDLYWDPEAREDLMARLQAAKSLAGVEVKFRH